MRYASGSQKKFLLFVASLMSLLPSAVVAQNARGKFTLAKQVRWGTAVLPAGEYSYKVERHAAGAVMLRNLNGGPSAIVLSTSSSIADPGAAPRLLLTQHGQDWFVTSMILGGDGEQLHFAPHVTAAALQEARRTPKTTEVSSNSTP